MLCPLRFMRVTSNPASFAGSPGPLSALETGNRIGTKCSHSARVPPNVTEAVRSLVASSSLCMRQAGAAALQAWAAGLQRKARACRCDRPLWGTRAPPFLQLLSHRIVCLNSLLLGSRAVACAGQARGLSRALSTPARECGLGKAGEPISATVD